MEDQQSHPDDVSARHVDGDASTLTADAAGGLGNRRPRRSLDAAPRGKRQRRPSASTTAPVTEPTDEQRHDGAADADAAGADDETLTARRLFARWRTYLVMVAAAVFVTSVTFAGASLHTYLADRAAETTRTEIARTAVAAVTTLWTYTPETIDTLADRAAQYLGGDFSAQYRKFLEAAAAPNKQAQVTDSTEVVGAGVESVSGSEAVAIVFTNTTATTPLSQNVPSLKYVGYRLTMKREDSRWLVTNMSTVSFTDLTPQL